MSVKIVHAADFHLDSAFGALSAEQARQRRRESRELLTRLCNYVNQNGVDLVLLAGDLFDSDTTYRETLEALSEALGAMQARVFIAPGNHDPLTPDGPYARTRWSDNVHIFTEDRMQTITFPDLNCAVHGAAFTALECPTDSVLPGFRVPQDGLIHIGLLHGDVTTSDSRYRPIRAADIAGSGLDYLALGHVHSCSGVLTAGAVPYAYCGCIEGRGFDELGERGFLFGEVGAGTADLRFVPFARRRYCIAQVDVTDGDALTALERTLPHDTEQDIYRLRLTGTPEQPPRLSLLEEALSGRFFALQLRDETAVRRDLWDKCGEDTLRGLFLQELRRQYDAAPDDAVRRRIEQAARFGTAAMDDREV